MEERRWGLLSLGLVIAGGIVVGGVVLSVVLWVLGMLAGLLFAVLRIASLVALAALVVWGVRAVLRERRAV